MSDIEGPIQAAMLDTLRVGYPSVFAFHPANGGYVMPARTVARLKWQGLVPGVPDLVLCWAPWQVGFIEVKAPKGRVSPEQAGVHDILRAMGHRVAVCRSVSDLIETLSAWNVPSRIQGRAA